MRLTEAPEALQGREKAIFWTVAIVCGASRFLALSRSLWEWDEALFCLAMRDYDVASHHPHPPGFPIYIAAAKLLRVFTNSDFHALQAVNIINVHAKRRNFSHKRKRISDWGPRWKKAIVTLAPGQRIEIFEGI